jgi:hypothetical protein
VERLLLASSVELRCLSGSHGKKEGAQGQQKQGPSEFGTIRFRVGKRLAVDLFAGWRFERIRESGFISNE